ncbi:MAG: hypothetical protein M9916_04050 [Crocinitomicaceae bacterium]|nr:hypothetical protein [Crocinitomicaceae bacterium]
MKKLLILAYDFPPYVSVGGLRPYSWYKHLKEFGVEPIVVTRQWENKYKNGLDYIAPSASKEIITEITEYGTIIRAPYFPTWSNRILLKHGENKYKVIRKSMTAFTEIMQFFFNIGPKKHIYFAAKKYLKNNQVDVIIATGDPFVLFHYANLLSKEYNTPWITDYRDPWSQSVKRQKFIWEVLLNQYLEKKIVSKATSGTCVNSIKEGLIDLFPTLPFHSLSNGYDSNLIDRISNLPQSSRCLTFSVVGTIYNWHPWKSVVQTFSDCLTNDSEVNMQFNFYGINCEEEVKSFVQKLPLKSQQSISIYPKMENAKLLEKIAQENVMILFNDYHLDGTKIYDYLGVKRKILLCYSNDKDALKLKKDYYIVNEIDNVSKSTQADLIQKTNSGIVVENEAHLKTVLMDLLEEFNQKRAIDCPSQGVEQYSRKLQVQCLATIIQTLK